MKRLRNSGSIIAVAALCCSSAFAQTLGVGASGIELKPLAPASGQEVSNAALLNAAEVRVLRVDIEPGGKRVVHSHDDVQFHLFIPMTGTARMEVDAQAPVDLTAWQPYLMKRGTRHGFTNTGTAPVAVLEVFVK